MKPPSHFDRATVKVNPDGLVSVNGQAVGWVRSRNITAHGTEIFEYGFHGTTHNLGPAVGLGYSRDGAAMACAAAYFARRA